MSAVGRTAASHRLPLTGRPRPKPARRAAPKQPEGEPSPFLFGLYEAAVRDLTDPANCGCCRKPAVQRLSVVRPLKRVFDRPGTLPGLQRRVEHHRRGSGAVGNREDLQAPGPGHWRAATGTCTWPALKATLNKCPRRAIQGSRCARSVFWRRSDRFGACGWSIPCSADPFAGPRAAIAPLLVRYGRICAYSGPLAK